jgi:NAD(P)-dependent dehydrogenase (short-subunit alcohol dehydrogenase family)
LPRRQTLWQTLAMDFFDLSGKTALVTGGSRGLGREIALEFARRGANVVIASRKMEACEAVAEEVRATGRRSLAVACHVGQWDALDALMKSTLAEFGRLDILVNNAGMSPLAPSSVETSEELFDKVVGVNFKGPFRLSALAGTHMVEQGGGSIISISSIGAEFPSPATAPYAASKAALNTLTMALAREYAPTVRVNTVMPGSFRTDIAKSWPDGAEARTPAALGRYGEPEEILTSVLYLASDYSSFTTGSVIRVDGGRYAPSF